MRIAIFTNNYLPNPYGVSGSIESFRKEFERQGHTVYVFAPEFRGYVDENKNVFRYPTIDLKFKDIRFPIAIPYSYRIDRILEKLEIDVVHSQHPNLLGWQAKRWAKKKNVPLVFTWHTLYDQYAHFAPLIPSSWAARWAIGNAVSYAGICDQVIVPTKSIKKIIIDWGVKNDNIVAIPTGIEEKQLENGNREDVRRKYGIEDDEVLLVVVTRFTQEKNMEFLFESIAKVLQNNSKVKFLAGGDGGLLDVLKNLAKKHDIENQVIFTGFVPNEIKKNYYAAGDVFVFASKSETQGMVISEAMYMGLPVVALDATGVRDAVKNGETGLLVSENENKFSDAVSKLVDDENLRKTFGENAKITAEKSFTSEICGQKMLEVYKEVIGRNE